MIVSYTEALKDATKELETIEKINCDKIKKDLSDIEAKILTIEFDAKKSQNVLLVKEYKKSLSKLFTIKNEKEALLEKLSNKTKMSKIVDELSSQIEVLKLAYNDKQKAEKLSKAPTVRELIKNDEEDQFRIPLEGEISNLSSSKMPNNQKK